MFLKEISNVIFLINIFNNVSAEGASVFQIIPTTIEQLQMLYNLNYYLNDITFWKDPLGVNKSVDVMIPRWELNNFNSLMKNNYFIYNVQITDVQKLLNTADTQRKRTRAGPARFRVDQFDWRSFHTLDEIYNWLDHLGRMFPDRVETIVAGRSSEGRLIKGVHLRVAESRAGVFVEAGIHAREWISHSTATYLINELLTSSDPDVQWLSRSYEWYIFPCVNPDGYVYTHINPRNPQFRLWRKTRSRSRFQHCSSSFRCFYVTCFGTDPNRNWDFYWGGAGSGRDPCSDIYAGKNAFSEIETRSLARYISSISNNLFAYISFHSYIEKLLIPYGHTRDHLDNYDQQFKVGKQAEIGFSKRFGNHLQVGNIYEALGGPASGGSIDWVKAQFKIPFVYCYELRGHGRNGMQYGFVPPPSEIIPSGQEVVDSLVALFKATFYCG